MQTTGGKAIKRGVRGARFFIAAAVPFLALAIPSGASADPVDDTVCAVRGLLSPLLGSCAEAEPDPQPTPTSAPSAAPTARPSTRASASPDARPKVRTATSPSDAEAPAPDEALPPPRQDTPAPSASDAPIQPKDEPVPTGTRQSGTSPFAALDLVFAAALSGGLVWLLAGRRRRAADQLAATAASKVERMKDEIVSNLSHELRTPLTPVVGYAKMLRSGKVPPAETRKIAEKLIGASAQLERTIDLLVTFAAIRGGSFAVRREPLDAEAIAQSVAAEHRGRDGKHDIVVTSTGTLPPLMGDARLVRGAIDQLIDNAVKFSPAGRQITVSVHPSDADPSTIEIAVADQGIGISAADMDTIFDEFTQADASVTRSYGGVGLGLAFASEVAHAHGGTIAARSRPGEGSMFTLRLPGAAAASQPVPVIRLARHSAA